MQELKDIRALEPINDISLYLFVIALVFVSLIIGALLYKLISTIRKRKEETLKTKVLQKLKNIEFNNPKEAAYKITKYGRFLADTPQSEELFEKLLPKLQKYKFIKDVPDFDDEGIKYYQEFLKSVDE